MLTSCCVHPVLEFGSKLCSVYIRLCTSGFGIAKCVHPVVYIPCHTLAKPPSLLPVALSKHSKGKKAFWELLVQYPENITHEGQLRQNLQRLLCHSHL